MLGKRLNSKGFFLLLLLAACAQAEPQPEVQTSFSAPVRDTLPPPQLPLGLQKLLLAYPDQLQGAEGDSVLIWKDGTPMRYEDGKKDKSHQELLQAPDLAEQLQQVYPLGADYLPLPRNFEPGRIRYEPFFRKMYGNSKKEVQQQLVPIQWLPKSINTTLYVTPVNGIAEKLQAISHRLDSLPHLKKYLVKPGGTFNWRNISGTERLSMHSFGATIDINVSYSNYWRWSARKLDENGLLPYQNRIPYELVAIFEEYGFIWGGKWYHYDTMHFEYRPELFPLETLEQHRAVRVAPTKNTEGH